MKAKSILIVASLSAATSLYALPDYEPFADATASGGTSYGLGSNLVGQVTAQSLGWFQAGASASTTVITNGNLAVPGLNPSIGNSIVMSSQNNVAARFGIGASVNSGTLYYSFALKVPDIGATLGSGGGFIAGFNNTGATSQGNSPTIVGARTLIRATTGGFNIGLSKASSTSSDFQFGASPTTFTTNDTIFIVASYTFGTLASTPDDTAEMWINPNPSDFGAASPPPPTLTATTGGDVITSGALQSLLLYSRPNNLFPNQAIIDELYIGHSWADVTPTGPRIGAQPQSQRSLAGNDITFTVGAVGAASYQWRYNESDITGAVGASLTLTNVQAGNMGSYRVVAINGSVSVTSSVATLTVVADTFPRLRPLWSIPPDTAEYPWVTTDSSNIPNQRSLAYNALSNQVLVVSRTNFVTGATNPEIYVLDASTGTTLYTLDTSAVTGGGAAGTPPLTLVSIDIADDGAVYAANVTVAAADNFSLYRWPDSASGQMGALVYQGIPNGLDNSARWGDTLRARGTGPGTEVIADSNDGAWFADFTPTDSSMTAFTCTVHSNLYSAGSIGRSLQFGTGNTYWEKRKGVSLQESSYDSTAYSYVTVITNFSNFPSTVGPVAFQLSALSNWLCGIEFSTSSSNADMLNLYEVSDLSTPLLIAKYSFPTNHQPNANFIGQIVFGGTNVYAIDANNGIAAFTWVPFQPPAPSLTIGLSGSDVVISWQTNATGYTLYANPSVVNSNTWTAVGPGTIVGTEYVVTNTPSSNPRFYRLQQ